MTGLVKVGKNGGGVVWLVWFVWFAGAAACTMTAGTNSPWEDAGPRPKNPSSRSAAAVIMTEKSSAKNAQKAGLAMMGGHRVHHRQRTVAVRLADTRQVRRARCCKRVKDGGPQGHRPRLKTKGLGGRRVRFQADLCRLNLYEAPCGRAARMSPKTGKGSHFSAGGSVLCKGSGKVPVTSSGTAFLR